MSESHVLTVNVLVFISRVVSGEGVRVIVVEIIAGCCILQKQQTENDQTSLFKSWDDVSVRVCQGPFAVMETHERRE